MSLLEIPVSVNKTRWPLSAGVTLDRTSFAATRSVCLEVALARPCTISVVTGPAPKFSAATRRVSMTPGKGGDDTDNPLHFSGEIKDWPTFKGNDPVSRRRPRHSVTPRGRTGASVVLCHEFFFSLFHPLQHPAQTAILCPTKFVCLLQVPSTPRVGFVTSLELMIFHNSSS